MPLPTKERASHGWLKLRSSCESCAASKLKCSQDKPTCSRCARRGVACEYAVAKRGGRKAKNHLSVQESSGGVGARHPTMELNATLQPLSSLSSANGQFSIPSARPLGSPREMDISGSSDFVLDPFGPPFETLFTGSADIAAGPEAPSPLAMELTDFDFFDTMDSFLPMGEPEVLIDDSLASENPGLDVFSVSGPSPLLIDPTSLDKEARNSPEDGQQTTRQPFCSCLVQALALMKHLLAPNTSHVCSAGNSQDLDKTAVATSIQAVITQNEATIEAVSTILLCSCSQDGYLLTIASLIVSKVLGRYATTTYQTSSLQVTNAHSCSGGLPQSEQPVLNPKIVSKYCPEDVHLERMAAQLILSKLHRVRGLVNQLSAKFKIQEPKTEGVGAGATGATPEPTDLHQTMIYPLSVAMFAQLDVVLRNQLRTLSLEMIERLRNL